MLGLVLSVVLAVLIGYQQGARGRQSEESKPAVTATQAQLSAAPVTPEVKNTKSTVTVQLLYNRPTTQPATLAESNAVASGVWWSYAVDALFLVVLFSVLAYQLSARTNLDAQNSPEFEDSLKLWGHYIVGVCDTPREIKRALNDLRYQAMTRRRHGPSATRGERLARSIRQFVTGRPEPAPVEIHVDEAALPARKAAELANLTDEEREYFLDPYKVEVKGSENLKLLIELKVQHLKQFQRWINDAKPAPEPVTNIGAENTATRTAHQA